MEQYTKAGRLAEQAEREAEAAEAAAADAAAAVAAQGPDVWLLQFSDAERAAVEGGDEDERLAASAHVLGAAPGSALDMQVVVAQYRRLAVKLHPDKTQGRSGEAFRLLHGARGFLDGYLLERRGVRAPGRLAAPRGAPRPPPPPGVPSPPPSSEAVARPPQPRGAGPTPEALRHVPPALRAWLGANVLGADAGEALTSPLTFACGVFSRPPTMHGATVGGAGGSDAWGWTVEATSHGSWQTVPWEHDVLVTVEDLGDGSLDALFAKARLTARKRRHVLVLLATQKGRKELGEVPGAALPLYIPAGGVPWGDAVGWADEPSCRRWHDGGAQPTHSAALDARGVPTMAAGEAVAAQQRHAFLGNDKPVYGVLFDYDPRPVSTDALAELAYVLAGVGGRPWQRRHATWRQGGHGAARPLQLRLQPTTARCDPMRPLRHCAWQGVGRVERQAVGAGAGPSQEWTHAATRAAAELRGLAEATEADGGMVPDGVVPSALVAFLVGVGERAGTARAAAAAVVAATCQAVQWASLARAREMAALLEAMGLHLPELLGGAGELTAQCATCGCGARQLFRVGSGTAEGDEVLREASRRAGDAVASRVPPACQGRVREAVAAAHARCGAEVCVACAAPRMAEAQRLSVAPDAAVGDDGAPERAARRRPPPRRAAVAATRAVQAGSDGESGEEGGEADGGGGDDAGGDGQRVGDSPDVREALWRSRCALAAATTRDTAVAFPGVERCPAAEVRRRSPQRHPFSQGASLLRGHVFRAGGRRWCVEEVTVVDAAGRLGVYAFDADTHTEATQLLTERCARSVPTGSVSSGSSSRPRGRRRGARRPQREPAR